MTSAEEPVSRSDSERAHSPWFIKAVIIMLLMQMAVNAIRPTVSYRALGIGASATALGIIAAGFGLLSLFCAIPAGRWIDRRGEMPFVLAGMAIITVVSAGLVMASGIAVLFASQALLGLGQVFTVVATQTLIANSSERHRDVRFGTFTAAVSLGQLVGPASSGFLIEHVTFHTSIRVLDMPGASVFVIAAGCSVVGLLLGMSTIRRGAPRLSAAGHGAAHRAPLVKSVGGVLKQPSAPQAMLASIAVITTNDLLVAYLPAYGERVGVSASTIGLLLAARAAASLISRSMLKPLVDLLGHKHLLVASTVVPAAALLPLLFAHASAVLFILIAVAGLGLGLGQPLSLIWITRTAPTHMRGTAAGVRLAGNRTGQVVIPALVGSVAGAAGVAVVFIAISTLLATSSVFTATGSFSEPRVP